MAICVRHFEEARVDECLRLRNPHEHHFICILCSATDVE